MTPEHTGLLASDVDACVESWRPDLGANDAAFLGRVYATPAETYRARIEAIGFDGLGEVLDAGCGFGQWSLALASVNDRVIAMDPSSVRIAVVRDLARRAGADGLEARFGRLPTLDLPDASVDGVFCYGVLFCTPWRESLAELRRILRPGGRLYINAPDVGWTLQKWLTAPNPAADYDPRGSAADDLRQTYDYDRYGKPPPPEAQLLIPADTLAGACESLGLNVLGAGAEGTVTVGGRPAGTPFFRGEYHGHSGFHELVAERG